MYTFFFLSVQYQIRRSIQYVITQRQNKSKTLLHKFVILFVLCAHLEAILCLFITMVSVCHYGLFCCFRDVSHYYYFQKHLNYTFSIPVACLIYISLPVNVDSAHIDHCLYIPLDNDNRLLKCSYMAFFTFSSTC